LRVLLGTEDPALVRLFPPGYASDPESDAQYRDMVKGDLTAERLAGLQTLERTLGSTSLDEEELGSWLSAINDMRLVLGTRLDVTEEINERGLRPGDDRASQFEVYGYLTWLESQLVEAMAAGLPGEGGS
jgi:hypothetical protein